MTVDRYTKAVPTVIAAALVWLCATSAASPIQAQQPPQPPATPPQPVVIVGWGTIDQSGRVTVARSASGSDPNIPVKLVGYPSPVNVRLEYTAAQPMPVGLTTIAPSGRWDPIRTSVESAPTQPRPGRD